MWLGLLASGPTFAAAQTDTVFVADDFATSEGNLNRVVDSVKMAGNLSTTVFKLVPYGRYVLTDTIIVPAGTHLTIVAPPPGETQVAAPPQILCAYSSDNASSVGIMFDCFGDITLKNIWLLYANTQGQQTGANVTIEDDSVANASGKGEVAEFENVIFDYAAITSEASGAVSVKAKHFRGTFRNCYWKNCVDLHLRYYGRAVSFPYASTKWHGDSVVFENCTFANLGYVLNQELGEYYDYVKFNHCTFLNVVMYSLEAGWWKKLAVTNSLFVNTYMYGNDFAFAAGGIDGGTIRIDSLSSSHSGGPYTFPFAESDRRILFAHSSYGIELWLKDWMLNNPASVYWRENGDTGRVPVPQPMLSPGTMKFFDSVIGNQKVFPYMNRANLHDSTNPRFLLPPSDTAAIKSFLYRRWWDSSDTLWAWKPENSINQQWPLEEDLAYSNQLVLSAGMGGFPLGDLYRWYPEKYLAWKSQATEEDARIESWLNTGADPGGSDGVQIPLTNVVPPEFSLSHNYPNPFNPATIIRFQLPSTSRVKLEVFDVLGRNIQTLVDDRRTAGAYTVTWDAHNLPSGVYFYRLKAGDFVSTKKLVVVK